MTNQAAQPRSFAPEPRLYTVVQVSQILSLSTRSVYRLIGQGDLDVRKIGRATRIVAESVDRFVKGSGK